MKTFVVHPQITDRHATLSNSEFRRAMEFLDATLDEMSERLGICRRLVAEYRKDKAIPEAVAFAVRYLLLLATAPAVAESLSNLVEWRDVKERRQRRRVVPSAAALNH